METTPDRLCVTYARKHAKITIRALDESEETILIEGEPQGLEFLGRLLIAGSVSEDCGFQIAPNRAGKGLFSADSTKGIYIHRLPCEPSNED